MNICVITTSSLLLLTKLHSTLKLHFGSVPSPVSQCLITSHSLPFHPVYTVITITSNCEWSFVTDLSVVVPSYILFLCYVHSSSCSIDNTSFVAKTTATTINLFTLTSLHVVAPHRFAPIPALFWRCWRFFWFLTQLFTQFQLQSLLSGFTLYCSQSLVQLSMSYFYC